MKRKNGVYYAILKPEHHFAWISGYIFEHRLVWEQTHKACLLPWADVHHRDRNTENNNPSNIQAMMKASHTRISSKVDHSKTFCDECGSTETYITDNKYAHWYAQKEGHICNKCYEKKKRHDTVLISRVD